ncbi:MAG: sigma-70 family RNA polymerase sigma factor [Anaerofustis stercorihominis]|nr:sigma-70 family RNA polymerase sigma factor [Anaerofustis stercorihominis]
MKRLVEELFKSHYKDIYTYLYGLSRDASLSEDLASEVFLEVIKSIAGFRGESDIKTWMFSIARHRWYAYLRKKDRQKETYALSELLTDGNDPVEEDYISKETADRICELIQSEADRTKDILLMRLDGYSFYEIGNRLNISESTARVIYFRAKTKIKETLKKEGLMNE